MELREIFKKIEEANKNLKNEKEKMIVEEQTLFEQEEEQILKEIKLMKTEEYGGLKNERMRKAFLNEETKVERGEIKATKLKIKKIELNIQFIENQYKMYNRMIDHQFYESE